MSITSTLTNALSGLTAAARTAEVISANVSNALTEGYGRREVMLSSISLNGRGAGVRVDGIRRVVDQAAIADRRLADAAFGATGARTSFLTRLEGTIGLPGDAASLSGRIAGLESALVDAASRPDSPARLRNVLDAASNLAGQFNRISTEIQSLRMDADAEISQQVGVVNDALSKISGLNNEILLHRGAGRDATALIDERQRLIDRIASIVPIREMPRENGQVALYTSGGSALLDGQPVVLGFARSNAITAEMTLEGGALSGLTLNGVPIDTGSDRGPIAGGAMAALFEIRDGMGPAANAEVDALARDLVDRFAAPGLDPTRAAGEPGLFTDGGAALDPAQEVGLAGRLSLNALVDPARGGELWRLRDGLGAAVPGAPGDTRLLSGFIDGLSAHRIPASGSFTAPGGSAAALAGDFLSLIAVERQSSEIDQSFAGHQVQTFRSLELQAGVDTDQEMQKLLLVEQSYAANARVIQTVDDMLKTLLGI